MKKEGVLLFLIALALFAINSNPVHAISTGNSSLANLTIWDDTDTIKLFNSNTTWFYANWTNITTKQSINNSGVYCNLTFSFLSTTPFNMTWNASLLLYTYK